MDWQIAPDLQKEVRRLIAALELSHIDPQRVIVFRSFGSRSRARARIWSLPRIWQKALKVEPHYCLEVLGEKFDPLSQADQQRILIHELLHIPKTFSGALLPHRSRGRKLDSRAVERLFRQLKEK